jgi:hypothetical protein
LVPFEACTASSRMRCRFDVTEPSAPSAVCVSDTASPALRMAVERPRICAVKRWEIARPAASSLAPLMRMPEDRRCSEVAISSLDVARLRCALSDMTLVLMI